MRAKVGEIEIEYELFGPEDGEPIVLVAGVFQQLSFWPTSFLDQLISAGFRVLVHDNRDVGLSTRESRPAPDIGTVLSGDVSGVNYTSSHMAADTAGLIDVLELKPAHVVGHSMGGMIAQRIAIEHPESVSSLTLFATNSNDGVTGQTSPEFVAFAFSPPTDDRDVAWKNALDSYRLCVLPELVDEEALTAFLQLQANRAPNPAMQCVPAIIAGQVIGLNSSPTHLENLGALKVSTMVMHGTGDTVIAFDGGEKLADVIPNARLVAFEGMGHFPLDPERWTAIATAIIEHARPE